MSFSAYKIILIAKKNCENAEEYKEENKAYQLPTIQK